MSIISFLSIGTAVYFCMMIFQRLSSSKNDLLNSWTLMVLACLAWWNLCDAFFYVAKTKEQAWFWHRIGAPGWCGFIAVTAAYFVVMTGEYKKWRPYVPALLFVPPAVLVLRFIIASPTALAQNLVQSDSGLGWTFVQRFDSIWTYLFFLYLAVYLGGSLFLLYRWQKNAPLRSTRSMAKGFILLDSIAVSIGFVSLVLIPSFTSHLPPMGCIATLVFGVWYSIWLRDYDFLHLELAMNPGTLLENCIDSMVVTDEEGKVLYVNTAAKSIMGEDYKKSLLFTDCLTPESRVIFQKHLTSAPKDKIPLSLELNSGIPVVCSVSQLLSRKNRYPVCVICMSEISRLKETQKKLDYLANYDELTGLYNRRFINASLERWKAKALATGEDFALYFLDLTQFKVINDTYGHTAGDNALIAVGKAILSVKNPEDIVGRFAGDEFVVLHRLNPSFSLEDTLKKKIQEVDSSLFAPGIPVDVDVGKALFSEVDGDTEALLHLADKRMYALKKARRISRPESDYL